MARVAGHARLALLHHLRDHLTGDLGRALEVATGEVAGGQTTGLVDDVHQHIRAVKVQATAGLGDVVGHNGLGELAASLGEEFLVLDLHARAALVIDDDRLDVAGAHHRTEAATTGITAGVVLRVVHGDARVGRKALPYGADADDRGLIGVALPHDAVHFLHPLAQQVGSIVEGDAVLVDVDVIPLPVLGLPFQNDGRNAQASDLLARKPSRVGFLDRPRQGALPTKGGAAAAGRCRRSRDPPGRDDQFVVGAQGMAGGIDFIVDNGGCQTAAGPLRPLLRDVLVRGREVGHVNA